MARKSMSQTKREEDKVAENASNKRKWEGNHNGSSSQQNKGHKVPRAHTTRPINKKAYAGSLPLCNQCKFHHNGPCTPALYNGYEIIKNNHVPALVHNTEDTLEIAEITRRKMNDKMKDPECVTHKVKIAPPDYSKENYLATFTPQKQLTPE
ncbi:hypothetical protein Tco_1456428 [Tanacetum coccineum]